jgi:lipocalin
MNQSKLILVLIAFCCIYEGVIATRCKFPPPSANFTEERYSGLWYEIGRYQTAGGGFF